MVEYRILKTMDKRRYILTLSCKDTSGIVSTVSTFLYNTGGFVLESSQYGDPITQNFFMRAEFTCQQSQEEISAGFKFIADRFKMNFLVHDAALRPNIIIAVSKASHCLIDLLHKNEIGALPANIVGIVSNHNTLKPYADRFAKKFYHFPISHSEKKLEQEQRILTLFNETDCELIVLARYMQILSSEMSQRLDGRAINIHHSFLPGFKGANPYQQAYDHGVKLIGATAHYVTSDLDEGPIIEQEVIRVDHKQKPDDLRLMGQDIEARVLFKAVKWHLEQRIILNGTKTVVF